MQSYTIISPLRITFAGGGTDVEPFIKKYGGAVVNSTIDRKVTVIYEPDEYDLEISSRDLVKSIIVPTNNDSIISKIQNLFYSKGIKKGRIMINNDVPPGSGLGSSSALTTAIVKLIHIIKNEEISRWDLARESYEIEKGYFGVSLGKQDPFAISLGNFKMMEFQNGKEILHNLSKQTGFIKELESRTLLVYTGGTRESSKFLKEQIDASKKEDNSINQKLLALKDIAVRMANSVENNDMNSFIELINDGWQVKRQLSEGVSNPKIESLIDKAKENGAQAVRLMGGGGEGFLLMIAKKDSLKELQESMSSVSDFAIRVSFTNYGTKLLVHENRK